MFVEHIKDRTGKAPKKEERGDKDERQKIVAIGQCRTPFLR